MAHALGAAAKNTAKSGKNTARSPANAAKRETVDLRVEIRGVNRMFLSRMFLTAMPSGNQFEDPLAAVLAVGAGLLLVAAPSLSRLLIRLRRNAAS